MNDKEFMVEKIRSAYTAPQYAGLAAAALAWPLGRHILDRERRKIAPQILRLTDELM